GHWMLMRLVRRFPDQAFAEQALAAMSRTLTENNLQAEAAYLAHPARHGFERPYGLAWLLQLTAELHTWDVKRARQWRTWLVPLERIALQRLHRWIPKLRYPVRSGEHSQSAFAFGLIHDYASTVDDRTMLAVIEQTALRLHAKERNAPLAFEPSGHDFLSPCLGVADLMRRVLEPRAFAEWLDDFLPTLGQPDWLPVAETSDRTDGKLAHLDGLNLSRAWMLEAIAAALPPGDRRREHLLERAQAHANAGLAAITGLHYAGAHWLASFAVYLTTAHPRRAPEAPPGTVD
ncbi:MAG: DUF2891 domain-containing protein, partial [Gammaproteobacteria bacterium]|nr:DUF2891 domain-containing protein [Gammaproteobacteria bacterium]